MILLHLWSRRRTVLTGRMAVAGLAAIPLLVAVQLLVTTDRERIIAICGELARAAGQADVMAFGGHISEDFQIVEGQRVWGKAELLDAFEQVLRRWDIEEERLGKFETVVSGDSAETTFRATCRLISNDLMVPRHVSKWELSLVKIEGKWRVTHMKPPAGRGRHYDLLPGIGR